MITKEKIAELFPGFEKDLIDAVYEKAEIKTMKAGDMLMKTGQYFKSTFLIVKGLVKIFREDDEGDEFFIYYLQPGQACALSMICATRQQTSQIMAKAVTDVTALTIPLQYMDEWMQRYRTWYYFVLESYRSRMDEMLQTIDHIAFRNMDERLVFYLRRQQEILKTNIITTSFTEIARELNSSREVISRLMKKLSEKGMLEMHRSHIELIDADKWQA